MGSETWHEQYEKLTPSTQDLHRAIQSLKEELDAIDWYQQRVDATDDAELKAILAHNRDEEVEHGAMVLEWIRRHNPAFANVLKTYLFTEGPVTAIEEQQAEQGERTEPDGAAAAEAALEAAAEPEPQNPTNLTVGPLKRTD